MSNTAHPIPLLTSTARSPTIVGHTYLVRIRHCEHPTTLAAVRYSSPISRVTMLKARRANTGMKATPAARISSFPARSFNCYYQEREHQRGKCERDVDKALDNSSSPSPDVAGYCAYWHADARPQTNRQDAFSEC